LLLRNKSQLPWLVIFVIGSLAALAFYVGFTWWKIARPTGGTWACLWCGIAGWALMIFAWWLTLLRWLPRRWYIWSRAAWLRGHVWLGSLCVVLILCHTGGLHWGGPFEQLLYIAFVLTILTGFGGLALQQFLPWLLTTRTACEMPYEQIPAACARLARLVAAELKKLQQSGRLPPETLTQLDAFHEARVRPFLLGAAWRRSPLADRDRCGEIFARVRALPGVSTKAGDSQAENALDQFEKFCAERRLLAGQERLQFWLHSWLYLHVPLSFALTILSIAHVVQVLCY
jgi:hypothetical protein